ncbi:hypothetical protein [Bacillus taeanensis]|uniref:hypothetical protein n=1 Tax=Bacillus taeanensis TaxID=273032 RepID=UPI0015F11071|nr:hypothetical protein [Bacillus taeanensis]
MLINETMLRHQAMDQLKESNSELPESAPNNRVFNYVVVCYGIAAVFTHYLLQM